MKAEDFWIQREVERNPGYDDMVKDQASDMSGIFKLMEEYHQSQLQALKEDIERFQELTSMKIEYEAYQKVLNLITNLEDKQT